MKQRSVRWIVAITLALTPALIVGGCKKPSPKKTKPTGETGRTGRTGRTGEMTPGKAPGKGPASRPGAGAASVPKLAGADAPPAAIAKALGGAPKMMLRANLASWMASPLTQPLLAVATEGVQKELKGCAKQFDVKKLKKALFVQSTGRLVRAAKDAPNDSHYAVVSADFDVPALLSCLAKAGTFKGVKLNGAAAFQPPAKVKGRPSWWFAVGKDKLVIVDGDWSKKVTPGKGPLGTGALLKHVGKPALRLWARDFAPDIPRVVAYLQLGDPMVARADVTWKSAKDAQAMTQLIQRLQKFKPELAEAMKPLRITVKGEVATFAIRATKAEAKAFALVGQMFFARGGSSKAPVAKKGAPDPAPKEKAPKKPAPKASK